MCYADTGCWTDKMYLGLWLTKCPGACANMSRSIDFSQVKGKFLFALEIYPRVFPRNGITFAAEKVKDLTWKHRKETLSKDNAGAAQHTAQKKRMVPAEAGIGEKKNTILR